MLVQIILEPLGWLGWDVIQLWRHDVLEERIIRMCADIRASQDHHDGLYQVGGGYLDDLP